MDVLTERGQKFTEEAMNAVAIFEKNCPAYKIVHTDVTRPVLIDGIIVTKKPNDIRQIVSVVEIKCRNMTREQLRGPYSNEWLLTFEKLEKARALCDLLEVPLYGLLYLIPDKRLLIKELYSNGRFDDAFIRAERTMTQATCNGGIANRLNAYITMKDAVEYI